MPERALTISALFGLLLAVAAGACSDEQGTKGNAGAAGATAGATSGAGGSGASAGTMAIAGMPNALGGAGGEAGADDVVVLDPTPPLAAAASHCPQNVTFADPLGHAPVATQIHDGSFGFLEGPVWLEALRSLVYTNFEGIGNNGRIHSYRPKGAVQEVLLEGVGVNGMAVDAAGLLVAAYHQEQRLIRIDPTTKQLIDVPGGGTYLSMPLNSVNDVVARQDGQLYLTDPTYQRGERPGQPVAGSYHLSPDGVLTLIDTQEAPNGIALSPNGHTLYIAGTGSTHPLMKYAVADDGSVTIPGAAISQEASDGMAVDCAGNLYLTTGGGSDGKVTVLSPEGTLLGSIPILTTSGTTNAAFGGPDFKTLFVTTNTDGLFEVPMDVPGLP